MRWRSARSPPPRRSRARRSGLARRQRQQAAVIQNLRSPDAQDAAAQVAQHKGSAQAQARLYAAKGAPSDAAAGSAGRADDGTPWMAIAAGFAALLILVGSVTLAGRAFMRTRRTGATV